MPDVAILPNFGSLAKRLRAGNGITLSNPAHGVIQIAASGGGGGVGFDESNTGDSFSLEVTDENGTGITFHDVGAGITFTSDEGGFNTQSWTAGINADFATTISSGGGLFPEGGTTTIQTNVATGTVIVKVPTVAELTLNDVDNGWDVNVIGTGGNGIRIDSDQGIVFSLNDTAAIEVNLDGSVHFLDSEVRIMNLVPNVYRIYSPNGLEVIADGTNFDLDNSGRIRVGVSGNAIGFFGSDGGTRPTVTGSRGGNAAVASLLTALANLGLITDSSS